MTGEQYWKLKALELERVMLEQNIQQAVQQFEQRWKPALEDAGLEVGRRYQFNDATCEVTPVDQVASTGPQLAVDNTPNL